MDMKADNQQDCRLYQRNTSGRSGPPENCGHQESWLSSLPERAEAFYQKFHRPLVTVSYAQSIDGSIASRNREQLQLSSNQSMMLTHRIRASCDAILIGINTLLIDDPQLTVRLVEGVSPLPIVLDSKLRIPPESRLLQRQNPGCLLASTIEQGNKRVSEVENLGAEVVCCRPDSRGKVDLADLLYQLGQKGIRSIMVEGGSKVITSFLESQLVDQMIITITPRLIGGLPVVGRSLSMAGKYPSLSQFSHHLSGPDIILWAQPQWQQS